MADAMLLNSRELRHRSAIVHQKHRIEAKAMFAAPVTRDAPFADALKGLLLSIGGDQDQHAAKARRAMRLRHVGHLSQQRCAAVALRRSAMITR